jgi:ligand-binding SRPBCC domain-containing protein
MKIYQLTRSQQLPVTLETAWNFFSNPANLSKITPPRMNFRIISNSGSRMYEGQIIQYKVNIFPWYTVDWISEISKVNEPFHFIDEQLAGPYASWQHQHHFEAVSGGIKMTDEISYAVPFGWIGQLANVVFVQRELNTIFDYRYAVLKTYFEKENQEMHLST